MMKFATTILRTVHAWLAAVIAYAMHAPLASEYGALTLAEAAKLSNDVVLAGVMDTIVNTSDLPGVMPYIEVIGNALTYNRENAPATVAWRAVGDVWTEDVPTYTQVTVSLTIVGGDADVDRYLSLTRRNVQDLDATVLLGKAQALGREWDDKMINGTGAANQPTGMSGLITGGQALTNGAAGAALTLEILDTLIDTVKGGAPDYLLMAKRDRRSLNKLFRASGASMETRDVFGRFIQVYNGVPILISDYIATNVTVGASNDTSTIYAFKVGEEKQGFAALYAGGTDGPIQVEEIGALETKDARRWRVKAYVALALFGVPMAAKSSGIRPA